MATITATNASKPRELIPADNYIARCYMMIHIGTCHETIMGKEKVLNKCFLGWELPTEMRVFDEAKGPQPLTIKKEFTLSMNPKSNLRKLLTSWRGQQFTDDEAKSFDITKLLSVPCLLNIVHEEKKDRPGEMKEVISSVSKLMKGMVCPPQINKTIVLAYDDFDQAVFNALPDFIKDKMVVTPEFKALHAAAPVIDMNAVNPNGLTEPIDDLPF